jgi:hypothetical protein
MSSNTSRYLEEDAQVRIIILPDMKKAGNALWDNKEKSA